MRNMSTALLANWWRHGGAPLGLYRLRPGMRSNSWEPIGEFHVKSCNVILSVSNTEWMRRGKLWLFSCISSWVSVICSFKEMSVVFLRVFKLAWWLLGLLASPSKETRLMLALLHFIWTCQRWNWFWRYFFWEGEGRLKLYTICDTYTAVHMRFNWAHYEEEYNAKSRLDMLHTWNEA